MAGRNLAGGIGRKAARVAALAGLAAGLACGLAVAPAAAGAVPCRTSGSFESWLEGVKAEARAAGVPGSAIEAGLAGVAYDPAIIRRDQGQGVFQQTLLTFAGRMVSNDRMVRGKKYLAQYSGVLSRIEATYGVPGEVLVAFWGLETDFGSDMGKYHAPTAVATLAYDCRRADYFRPELIDLLRIVARGDLKPSEMFGDWAGELGHLMFTPTDLYRYAADGDGDGRINVMRSVPDAFATGANFLRGLGWRRGEPWLEEVSVPADMDWSQADLDTMLPRAAWSRMGVRTPAGGALAAGGPSAALLLPMGRNGPAFLAYPNFKAYLGWNKAMVYSTTAAYYATRLDGAPAMSRGRAKVTPLTTEQMRHLQGLLRSAGFTRDAPDGRFGKSTRAAVRAAQMQLGLPADGYPTPELLAALEGRR
ncbi:lytic murein transglycosylase [Blastochloris sulfoviridis]|uniref:Lytic murein transglycosylase n=2 Tax=Blastochloris sulfoviridis TaxID=50712 RepID=A0A5M6HX40_9HYPH|nr:lytic murein transglycosylase [Blastochloris sulfoviridis]